MKRIIYSTVICCLFISQIIFAQKGTATLLYNPETGIQYLSGTGADDAVDWEFFCTDGRNSGKWTTIKVPSCWELQGFGTYQYGMPFYGKADPPGIAKEQGKYKYKFKLPKEWEGRVVNIVFEAVMTDCEANINGRRCVKLHQGGFYRFKSDVSDRIFFGDKENLLEVTVSKESSNPSVNLAERRADYWNFGGIIRPIFVEALPPQNISRLAINARANGHFHADVFLGSALGNNYKIVAQLSDANDKKLESPVTVPVTGGTDKVEVKGTFLNISPWTAETPNLYYMTFSLMENDKVVHQVKQRFGFRTIEVKESDGIYINGKKIMVRGVNRHSFRPETGRTLSKKDNYDDVKLIKEMNMNAVRMSHYPPDPAFLEACDELGLYVMNELGGWHGKYDSNVGKQLVYELITRDVNHPSIIWWSNGNEKGWNTELDREFKPLDPQKRPVLHPQGNFGGFETMHYRSYGESMEYMRLPEIWMPTEFLHGLYDGGHGAGLWDYWEIMRKHPRCAGGFLWVFADEGVVRTDQNGRIDNVGNYGADGIVGPHHEREASFYTVKQVWSPVQIMNKKIGNDFSGIFELENRYDFTNLKDCRFEWRLEKVDASKARIVKPGTDADPLNPESYSSAPVASGKLNGPDIPARSAGQLKINLPSDWKNSDILYLTAYGPNNEELWTWDWTWKNNTEFFSFAENKKANLSAKEEGDNLLVNAGQTALTFNRETGELVNVKKGNQIISLSNGPRFIAARRGDRSMDVYYNHDDKEARSKERIYYDISGKIKLTGFSYQSSEDSIVVESTYFGDMQKVRWVISSDETIRMDYEYQFYGTVELMGIKFDYPESNLKSKRWMGKGPYRVWQNRWLGTKTAVWENDYNDPVPGESFLYPEFKGYFADWKWVTFNTTEGEFSLGNGTADSYLGVFTPRDGRDVLLYTLPETGIAVLKVIPGVRNKVNSTDLVGPSSLPQWSKGSHTGSLYFKF